MANIQTPDSIGNPLLNFKPAAKNVSVYQGASRADVPDAVQGNSYLQLGQALETFAAGTGVTLSRAAAEKQKQDDLIAGKAASEKAQKANVKSIDEMVAKGIIPAGGSPVFMQALRENQLSYAADKHRQSLLTAYHSPEQADLRASNDPEHFNAFVRSHDEAFDQTHLLDKNGAPIYTDLDLARSKYHDRAREATNAVYGQHLTYRVSENEKAGEEIAGLRTTQAVAEGLDNGHSHATIAAHIASIYRDPNTGLVVHGMPASKQSTLTVDAVVSAAVERVMLQYSISSQRPRQTAIAH